MRNLLLLTILAVAISFAYHSVSIAQIPPCPCDTATLSNGLSGNEIIDIVCPGGTLGDESAFTLTPDLVNVFLDNAPFTTYLTKISNPGGVKSCEINTNGVLPTNLQLTD